MADVDFIYKMDEQQGPTLEPRELYSIFYDKPQWKRLFEKGCMYMYTLIIYKSLCYTAETNTPL